MMCDRIQIYLDEYIRGQGIEIGHGIAPLVKDNVVYVDPNETTYDGQSINAHIKGRMENLSFEDNKFDFVVWGDVLEHLTNPIKGLKECRRVLSNQGILVGLIPDKNKTFDKGRPITTLQHLIDDFTNNTSYNDDKHWEEWCNIAILQGHPESHHDRIHDKKRQIENGWLHHHVFDIDSIKPLFEYVFYSDKILVLEKDIDRDNDKILIILEVNK